MGILRPCFVRVIQPDFGLGNIITDSLETIALNALYIARAASHTATASGAVSVTSTTPSSKVCMAACSPRPRPKSGKIRCIEQKYCKGQVRAPSPEIGLVRAPEVAATCVTVILVFYRFSSWLSAINLVRCE